MVDHTLKEMAQIDSVRSILQPARQYVQDVVDRLTWLVGLFVGLQVLLVLLVMGDFLLTLRSTVLVAARQG